jgi:hydroxymethylpyrimidine/phosphomethylpyrimidine kinase
MLTALTIAGSDSSAGAGIQADLKTFAAHGVFAATAVTAVTVQNSRRLTDVIAMPPAAVAAQIDLVAEDYDLAAVKIGMLATGAIAAAVAERLSSLNLPNVVLDTVISSTTGVTLLDAGGIAVLRDQLLPAATVVTVNAPEAELLTGLSVTSIDEARQAAMALGEMGARAVIVKGGHLEGPAIDLLFDGRVVTELYAERILTRHTHGTGCTFASALAARLALGDDLVTAARAAKDYVTRAIRHAPGLGQGRGPLGH